MPAVARAIGFQQHWQCATTCSSLPWRGPWASNRSDELLNVFLLRCTLGHALGLYHLLAVLDHANRTDGPCGSWVPLGPIVDNNIGKPLFINNVGHCTRRSRH